MGKWKPEDIKAFRQSLELSQEAFAKLLGVTRNFIYYLERGERSPSQTIMLLLDCIADKQEKEKEKGKEDAKHGKRHIQVKR